MRSLDSLLPIFETLIHLDTESSSMWPIFDTSIHLDRENSSKLPIFDKTSQLGIESSFMLPIFVTNTHCFMRPFRRRPPPSVVWCCLQFPATRWPHIWLHYFLDTQLTSLGKHQQFVGVVWLLPRCWQNLQEERKTFGKPMLTKRRESLAISIWLPSIGLTPVSDNRLTLAAQTTIPARARDGTAGAIIPGA